MCRYDVLYPERSIKDLDCIGFDESGSLAADHRSGRLWMSNDDDTIRVYDNEKITPKIELSEEVGG